MNIVIIEDEPLAAERLEELINEIDPLITIKAKIPSIKEATLYLQNNVPDLIFLDIQLSDGKSFKILEDVQIESPIIFTTAFDQFAVKAFKFNSIDYLLKPIRKDELAASILKYKKLSASRGLDMQALVETLRSNEIKYKNRFLIQFGQRIKTVNIDEIAFFFAMEKNVFIKTFDKAEYPVDFSLDKLEEIIDPADFFRINRKMIINLKSIKNMIPYSRSRIKVETTPTPPTGIDAIVSIERTSRFKQWLDN
ncbi:MAG: LytTR family DNA-binding domain-containing protein [Bacteroidetes bacterium]|nr:LytTR family DNA-binding domain-containing protein [Bacteroidota bacterium]